MTAKGDRINLAQRELLKSVAEMHTKLTAAKEPVLLRASVKRPDQPWVRQHARHATSPLLFAEDLILPSTRGKVRFGDVMAPFQRERFEHLAPDLLAVLAEQPPPCGRHFWEGTKGSSKDTDLAAMTLWLMAFADRPIEGRIGAADRDQAAELRGAAKDFLAANPWLAERVEVNLWDVRCPATGACSKIVAADSAGSHGGRPDWLVLNELHAISDGKREFVETMMDNAEKVERVVVIATNAGFQHTWQFQWREDARTSPDWFFHRMGEPAPWITAKALARAERRNSRTRFQRLWLGIWVPQAGDAIDQADIDAALTMARPHETGQEGWLYIAGLDLGVKRDHAALVILGIQPGSGRVAVAKVKSWRPIGGQVDLRAVREYVREAAVDFGLWVVLFDPHQAELMAQDLIAQGVRCEPMLFVGRNLDRMASTLMQSFRSRTLDMYREPDLLADLQRLTIEERKWGYKLTSATDDQGHADRAIALAIALPEATELASMPPVEGPTADFDVVQIS